MNKENDIDLILRHIDSLIDLADYHKDPVSESAEVKLKNEALELLRQEGEKTINNMILEREKMKQIMNKEYFMKACELAKYKEASARDNLRWAQEELDDAEDNFRNAENKVEIYYDELKDAENALKELNSE